MHLRAHDGPFARRGMRGQFRDERAHGSQYLPRVELAGPAECRSRVPGGKGIRRTSRSSRVSRFKTAPLINDVPRSMPMNDMCSSSLRKAL